MQVAIGCRTFLVGKFSVTIPQPAAWRVLWLHIKLHIPAKQSFLSGLRDRLALPGFTPGRDCEIAHYKFLSLELRRAVANSDVNGPSAPATRQPRARHCIVLVRDFSYRAVCAPRTLDMNRLPPRRQAEARRPPMTPMRVHMYSFLLYEVIFFLSLSSSIITVQLSTVLHSTVPFSPWPFLYTSKCASMCSTHTAWCSRSIVSYKYVPKDISIAQPYQSEYTSPE